VDIAADPALPQLRQELRIEPGAPLVTGAPSWTLFDPVRHLFFQLGRLEMRVFSLWSVGTLGTVRAGLSADGLEDEEADRAIGGVLQFSLANRLTVRPDGDAAQVFAAERAHSRKAWWRWLVDHYLFIRIPLVKPAAFLERTLPKVEFLWSSKSMTFFAALALVGFFLVARQWDSFLASFSYFFSLEGLLAYGAALTCVKIVHELGHAYTATRYGCRVPAMGISLLVMMPVLYTDTTAAWRLRSRRKRLAIDIAGVAAELMVASIATLCWVVLPEGSLRSAAFVLATSSWAMSLAINLNPFMRYDGYYILSDLLGVPNLQNRAFALGRWKLREGLFDLGEAPPEDVPHKLQIALIAYAFKTWLYRLVLFVGLAFLVYHMFFKLLGILLFAVEIGVFVARPILMEMVEWSKRKDIIMERPRARIWGGIGVAALIALVLPLDRHVSAPAVLTSTGSSPLVAGEPSLIERVLVHEGQKVAAGTPIIELSSPDLAREADLRRINVERLQFQLDRSVSDQIDLSNRAVLEHELASETEALTGYLARSQKLVLNAPTAGVVVELSPEIHAGRWVGGAETLARIVTPGNYDVQAFLGEGDAQRVNSGALARFVPNDPTMGSVRAKLVERANSALTAIDQPILASTNGGPIAVDKDVHALKPHQTLFRARLVAEKSEPRAGALVQTVPGEVRIEAESRSVLGNIVRWIMRAVRGEASLSD
jgi:putative peptide zinc metalloprotease protein